MPSSDVRSSETSAQNARGKNFQKFTCSNFRGFVFLFSRFLFSRFGRGSRKSRKFGPRENFPLYGNRNKSSTVIVSFNIFPAVSPVANAVSPSGMYFFTVIWKKKYKIQDVVQILLKASK